ncbi:hypothetical protein ACFSVM_15895 [Paenibacillus shunpengii]|uniref:Uncharacterized protein n=1 Tax=Paenibacillus shunpengii TaxID=2054424 RepID=A0ABW5SSR8_9BACL
MAIIVTQLPEILRSIKEGDYNFEIDFNGQGIERNIVVKEKDAANVELICIQSKDWEPIAKSGPIMIPKAKIKQLILDLCSDFILFSKGIFQNHPFYNALEQSLSSEDYKRK